MLYLQSYKEIQEFITNYLHVFVRPQEEKLWNQKEKNIMQSCQVASRKDPSERRWKTKLNRR